MNIEELQEQIERLTKERDCALDRPRVEACCECGVFVSETARLENELAKERTEVERLKQEALGYQYHAARDKEEMDDLRKRPTIAEMLILKAKLDKSK